jgi:hypothetical protein
MIVDAVTVSSVAVIPKACSFRLAGSSNQQAFAAWKNHLSGHASADYRKDRNPFVTAIHHRAWLRGKGGEVLQ